MRNLFFGLFIYLFVVSVLFHDYVNVYSTLAGILTACVLSGIGIGNVLGAISHHNQERE